MIYVNLPLGSEHGWGVCGKYITRELAKLEPVRLVALPNQPFEPGSVGDVLETHELHSLLLSETEAARFAVQDKVRTADGPLLQAVANKTLVPIQPELRGRPVLGYTFFEDNLLHPDWIANGRRYFDRVITGSSWCTKLLTEAGLERVATVIQGIDPAIFYPAPGPAGAREFLQDKFVVFSGGKFELRKGQDIVIRAFKVLQDRHPDVMLVNAWYNAWQYSLSSMHASPLIRFAPQKGSYLQFINQVLTDNGIDVRRVLTSLPQPNFAMARLYRNTDVGLFPNRCEGGTNLVLMEYMACGQPVIAVNSTGHADIVNANNALVINTKGEMTIQHNHQPLARWPEPDLDDTVDKLEWAYQHRPQLRALGQQAAKDLAAQTWRQTAEAFQQLIRESGG